MQNQRIIFLSITILSFLLGQEEHDHHDEHGHHKELSIAYAPGLLFVEHEYEIQFAQHLELCYEFELK